MSGAGTNYWLVARTTVEIGGVEHEYAVVDATQYSVGEDLIIVGDVRIPIRIDDTCLTIKMSEVFIPDGVKVTFFPWLGDEGITWEEMRKHHFRFGSVTLNQVNVGDPTILSIRIKDGVESYHLEYHNEPPKVLTIKGALGLG